MDLYFDSTATYTSTTAEYPMGLNISGIFQKTPPRRNLMQKTDSLIDYPIFSHRSLDFVQRRLPVHTGRRNHYDCRIDSVDDLLSPKKQMENQIQSLITG